MKTKKALEVAPEIVEPKLEVVVEPRVDANVIAARFLASPVCKSRIPMSIFLELLKDITVGRPPAPYRIVFVSRGHPVTRCRRRLRDATRHTVLPGPDREVKLSAVLDVVSDCCGSARRCQRAQCEAQMQQVFCCGPQDFNPFLEALAAKPYIQLTGDDICLTPDP